MSKKKVGILCVLPLKLWPDFLDAQCVKTGRMITFQFRNKWDFSNEFLANIIKQGKYIYIRGKTHDIEDMYWYCGLAGNEWAAINGRAKKSIAYQNLLEECRKDTNPARGRGKSGKGKNGYGRNLGVMQTITTTTGIIGGSLIRNIRDPEVEKFKELERNRKNWEESIRRLEHRVDNIKDNYRRWRKTNYGTMDEFLVIYSEKGETQKTKASMYHDDIAELANLRVTRAEWKRLCRVLSVGSVNSHTNTLTVGMGRRKNRGQKRAQREFGYEVDGRKL